MKGVGGGFLEGEDGGHFGLEGEPVIVVVVGGGCHGGGGGVVVGGGRAS